MADELRQCSKCGEYKPATTEYFYANKHVKSGLRRICKTCFDKESDKYYAEHKEALLKYKHDWNTANSERMAERRCEYYSEHSEEIRQRKRLYSKEHPEIYREYRRRNAARITERRREYRKKHADRIADYMHRWYLEHAEEKAEYNKEWQKKHPELIKGQHHRRMSRKRNLPDTFSAEEQQYALKYWNNCCSICGKPLNLADSRAWTCDHWISLSDPREDNPGTVRTNMTPMCNGKGCCNTLKHNTDPLVWLNRTYPQEQADMILVGINMYFQSLRDEAEFIGDTYGSVDTRTNA